MDAFFDELMPIRGNTYPYGMSFAFFPFIKQKNSKGIKVFLTITLNGVDQAISNLNYKNNESLKYRLASLIRHNYTSEGSVESLKSIPSDEIVKALWDTGDDFKAIKTRRKNLNTIKSSVNADFKSLYHQEKNPEGIIIGPDNIFVMSDEAKAKTLEELGYELKNPGKISTNRIMDLLQTVNDAFAGPEDIAAIEQAEYLTAMDKIRSIIKGLSETVEVADLKPAKETADNPSIPSGTEPVPPASQNVDTQIGHGFPSSMDEARVGSGSDTVGTADSEEGEAGANRQDDGDASGGFGDQQDAGFAGGSDSLENELPAGDIEPDAFEDVEEIDDTDPEEVIEELEDIETEDVIEEPLADDDVETEAFTDGNGQQDAGFADGSDSLENELPAGDIEPDAFEDVEEIDDTDPEEVIEELEDVETEAFTDRNGQQDAGFADGSDSLENELPEGDIEPDAFEDVEEIDDTDPDVEEIDDTDPEVEEIDDTDQEEVIEELEEENRNEETGEEIGLPVESLESERSYEHDDDMRKKRLLAEEFDGYLGTMDRYCNHYILIPGGNYIVGSKQPRRDEKPERVVRLESFYLGRFPVTNALFEIFVEKTGYRTTAEKVGHGAVYYGRFQRTTDVNTGYITSTWNSSIISKTLEGACWYQPLGPGSMLHNKRNHPVVQISHEDAMAFAAWTGKRLPTEDEWEAAARTANGWIYPWGEDWREDCCNIESNGIGNTTAVDTYLKFENEFGIVDTIGNVLEWTIDGLGAMNPDETGRKHAISKGGSWISGDDVRLTGRFRLDPETHSNILGFRCVAY